MPTRFTLRGYDWESRVRHGIHYSSDKMVEKDACRDEGGCPGHRDRGCGRSRMGRDTRSVLVCSDKGGCDNGALEVRVAAGSSGGRGSHVWLGVPGTGDGALGRYRAHGYGQHGNDGIFRGEAGYLC